MNMTDPAENKGKQEDADSGRKGKGKNEEEEISEAEVFSDEESSEIMESEALYVEEGKDSEVAVIPVSAELTHEEDSSTLLGKNENKEMKRLGSLLKTDESEDIKRRDKTSLDTRSSAGESSPDEAGAGEERLILDSEDEQETDPGERKGEAPSTPGTKKDRKMSESVLGSFLAKYKIPLTVLLAIILIAASWPYLRPQTESIEVYVPAKKIGDFGEYKVWGTIVSTSPENEIERVEFEILDTSTMGISIKGYKDVQDGFGLNQNAYSIETTQDLKVEGIVETGFLDGSLEVEGDINIEEETYFVHEKAVRSHIYLDLDANGKSGLGSVKSTADVDMFPSLTSDEQDKTQLDDVYREKTIKKGDKGTLKKGDVTFEWSVTKQETVRGKESLLVEYQFDKEELRRTLSENYSVEFSDAGTVDEAYMRVWVTNGRSLEMKRKVFIKVHENDTQFKFDYNTEMLRYSQGTEEIREENLDSPAKHELALREPWGTFPRHGDPSNSSIPVDFTLRVAYNEANASNDEFSNYIGNHTSDYLVYGKYNESNDFGIWNFTYSRAEAPRGFIMNVTRHSGTMISNDFGERLLNDIDPTLTVTKDRNELPSEMITFASAEQIFKSNARAYDKAFMESTGRINFDDYSLGVRTNLAYPGVDITTLNFDIESSSYAYFIKSEGSNDGGNGNGDYFQGDGFVAGVDAYTGQILFVGEYDYEASLVDL